MIGMLAAIAGALILTGLFAGFLIAQAIGIHREEKAYSLTIESPDRLTTSARATNGLYARKPGVTEQISHPRADRLALAGHGPRS